MQDFSSSLIDQLSQDKKIRALFVEHGVLFAYLFGSHAKGTAGKMSDVDLAVFLSEKNFRLRFEHRLSLISKLSALLHAEVEIVVLNDAGNNYLLADIVRGGKLIFDQSDDQRFLFEVETQHRVTDFLTHVQHVTANPHRP